MFFSDVRPMQVTQDSLHSPTSSSSSTSERQECAGCKKAITERFMLQAMEQFWHEDCLKCSCCDCRLGEVGSTLFTKANLLLCRRDYLRYDDQRFYSVKAHNFYRHLNVSHFCSLVDFKCLLTVHIFSFDNRRCVYTLSPS